MQFSRPPAPRLDACRTPLDVTTLNATTSQHGLLPKLAGGTTLFLRADGTWATPAGGGGGEANTASNVGTAGVGVFKQKTGVNLEFKKINAGSSKITITDDTGNSEVDIDVVEANLTLTSLGGTLSVAKGGTGGTSQSAARTNLGLGALAVLAAVGTTEISNNAVTVAKLQTVPTDIVLGRSTAGTGNFEQLTCTAAGRALLAGADAAAQRTSLGLGALAVLATVGTTQITNDAVTFAKFQNISTGILLGRSTASSGDVEEISLGTGLDLTAGVLSVAGGGSGEINTASNVGTAGVGVFKTKVGVDLRFKKINAGSSKITITDDTGDDEIDVDVVEANLTLTSIGGTLSVAKGGTGGTTQSTARTGLGLGTSAVVDVPSSGNASSSQVVKGDDTRLTDSRAPSGAASGSDLTGTYPSPTIASNAVTLGKMQQIATDLLLGRATSGTGNVETIACTAAGRALLDDADASAQRITLGLGSLSVLSSVDTGQLTNDAVTFAKMQNIATNKLLGRSTASTGDIEVISLGTGLTLTSGTLSASAPSAGNVLPGTVMWNAGTGSAGDWLLCDGSAVSRSTYAELFGVLGTTYGVGDGSTTFNLPDLRGRGIIGAGTGSGLTARTMGQTGGEETHVLTTTEMPSHTHTVNTLAGGTGVQSGTSLGSSATTTGSAGSDGAHNNMQPYIVLTAYIFAGTLTP